MFRPPLTNPSIKRHLQPLYAQHQATPWSGYLSPTWNKAYDILPGMVMTRLDDELWHPYQAGNHKPFGLAAFFLAPTLGIDEVSPTGSNACAVWVGGSDTLFEVLAPSFDTTASWTTPGDGSRTLLTGTATSKLTPAGATAANAVAELIAVVDATKIKVRLISNP